MPESAQHLHLHTMHNTCHMPHGTRHMPYATHDSSSLTPARNTYYGFTKCKMLQKPLATSISDANTRLPEMSETFVNLSAWCYNKTESCWTWTHLVTLDCLNTTHTYTPNSSKKMLVVRWVCWQPWKRHTASGLPRGTQNSLICRMLFCRGREGVSLYTHIQRVFVETGASDWLGGTHYWPKVFTIIQTECMSLNTCQFSW